LFKKGDIRNTRWIIRFDVLRAEKIAEVGKGFSGGPLGTIGGALLGGWGGAALGAGVGSVSTGQVAGVWIVGIRYKIIDAQTTQQVAQGYAEDKMEVGSTGTSVLGVSSQQTSGNTLDALVIKLVQRHVTDIDLKHK
jgi:hypothetical protein